MAFPTYSKARTLLHWPRMIPFMTLHAACCSVIWVGVSWTAAMVAAALYLGRMFAITGFYHRYFSHRSFKTSRTAQFIFAVIASSAGQRGPIWWAAHHRHHHSCADTPDDLHSPSQHGFLWSHMLWFMSDRGLHPNLSRVNDLLKYPELRLLDKFDVVVPSLLGSAVFSLGMILKHRAPQLGVDGWQLLVWGFVISTLAVYHCTYTINSLSHVFGQQRYDTRDSSRNNFWLALITLGEGWHNNHHHYPAATRQGFFWWEIDLTFYGLKALSYLGIIWDLKPVPESARRSSAAARLRPLQRPD
jgi:stearoyl-CoA desaturase (delta-9 desaturase)